MPRDAEDHGGRDGPADRRGGGNYTAILARLVGPTGKVVAYEIEADIAERATENLSGYPSVEVRAASGVTGALPKADVIYVSAAASHPVRAWLDALNPGGRLMFPLQAANSSGAMLLIARPREASDAWPAKTPERRRLHRLRGRAGPGDRPEFDAAFRRGGADRVRWLRFDPAPSDEVWLQGDGWALTADRRWANAHVVSDVNATHCRIALAEHAALAW